MVRRRKKNRGPKAPKFPTLAVPGTWEKIQVLADRVARGEALWHPEDVQDRELERIWEMWSDRNE